MKIYLKGLSNTHHQLRIVREDGSEEHAKLETKTFLFHDLLHLAAESVAGIEGGFWGLLASGSSFESLSGEGMKMDQFFVPKTELECMEVLTGGLTGIWKAHEQGGPTDFDLKIFFKNYGVEPPSYLTDTYADETIALLKRLLGQWRSTPFGETLQLTWPLTP